MLLNMAHARHYVSIRLDCSPPTRRVSWRFVRMSYDSDPFSYQFESIRCVEIPLVHVESLKVCDHADRIIKLGHACFINGAFYDDVGTAGQW